MASQNGHIHSFLEDSFRKQCEAVAILIKPNRNQLAREVMVSEHDIDMLIELAYRIKRMHLKRLEVVGAVANYYSTVIKPANSYITDFRFVGVRKNEKNILQVFATIKVNLVPVQSDSLILGTKVP